MLNTEPDNLLDEIDGALRERRLRLGALESLHERYRTPWFRAWSEDPLAKDEDYDPENHSYEYVAHMLPQLVYSNPTVSVSSRRGDSVGSAMTASYKHGLRQWIADTRYSDVMETPAVDYLFPGGFCVMVTPTRNPTVYADESWDEEPEWPQVVRISPRDYFRDPLALSRREARFEGHRWIIDKDDLEARAKKDNADDDLEWGRWDMAAIEGLSVGTGTEDFWESRRRADRGNAEERDQVVCYTVWIPEYTEDGWPGPDEGFHGGEFTLAASANDGAELLRSPRPFFGPRWGPYEACATYVVPDDAYEMAVLVASEGQARDHNRHSRAVSAGAARYKRMILCGPGVTDETIATIQDGEHDLVVRIDTMPRDAVEAFEIGGVTAQQLEYLFLAKNRVQENMGLDAAKRGSAEGKATATEVAVADTASQIRVDYVKQVWHRANVRVLTTVAWYMWHSRSMRWPIGPEILQDLGPEAVERMTGVPIEVAEQLIAEGIISLEFKGGDGVAPEGGEAKRTGIRFDDLQIEIAPLSMERVSQATRQAKARGLVELIGALTPLMVGAPFIHWQKVLEEVGDGFGMDDLAEMFDLDAFGEFVGLQQELAAAGAGPQGGAQAPSRSAPSGGGGSPAQARPKPSQGPGTPWGGQSTKRAARSASPLDRGPQKAQAAIGA